MKITRFEEIEGWQHGRELTRMVYENSDHAKSKVGAFIAYLLRSDERNEEQGTRNKEQDIKSSND